MIRVWFFSETDKKQKDRQDRERIEKILPVYTGSPWFPDDWTLCRDERGKPYFSGHPEVHISITDSGAYRVYALSDAPVGIDLQKHGGHGTGTEPAGDTERHIRLGNRYFHPEEAAYVRKKNSATRFYRIWTAKEAYVKYTGRGIDGKFGRISVAPAKTEEIRTFIISEGSVPRLPGADKEQVLFYMEETGESPEELQGIASGRRWKAQGAVFSQFGFPHGYTLCIVHAAEA